MPAYNEKKISIHSPATVANLVSGFDVMGLALSEPQDWMSMRLLTEPVIRIKHLDAFGLSEQPGENVAGAVLLAIQRDQGGTIGFEIEINKHIKPGSGIGSSAASAAGAAVGANYLLGNPYSPTELVKWAMEGEYVASGSRHPDNVTPGIFGGVTLVRSADPLDIIPLDYPNLFVALVHPQVEVKTADARNILSPAVTLKQAIRQWGNLGALVAGFLKKDYDLIARSLEDHIVEPQRRVLIPGYDAVKAACATLPVLGGGISGSGPSLFMLSRDMAGAEAAAEAMAGVYESLQIPYHIYLSGINGEGVMIKEIES